MFDRQRNVLALVAIVCILTSLTAQAQEWRLLGEMSSPRALPRVAQLNDEEVLVAGGVGPTASCEIINVKTGTIRETASMTIPRAYFAMVTAPDGRVIALSGWKQGSYTLDASIEAYDPTQETWTRIGALRQARFQHTATMIDDHRILVVGGRNEDIRVLDACEIFDLRTLTSTPAADFPFYTTEHSAVILADGRVAVFGGRSGGPGSFRSDVVYAYDSKLDAWDTYASMPEQTFRPGAVVDTDGSLVVVGGSAREYQDSFETLGYVAVLGDSVGRTLADRLSPPRQPQGVVKLNDGRKLIVGGWLGNLNGAVECEFINAANTEVAPGPSLRVGRGEAVCIGVQRGADDGAATVLSIGGFDSTRDRSAVVEILQFACDNRAVSLLPSNKHGTVAQARAEVGLVRLTPAEQFARGAVWAADKVDLTQPFTMMVGFRMTDGDDNGDVEEVPSDPGADGIALVIQNEGPQAIGQYGRGIGYDGIKRSLAVEFDTYHNTPVNDPNGNHVGVQSMGRAENSSKHTPPANLAFSSNVLPMKADGTVYYAYLTYINKRLSVYLNSRPSFQGPVLVRDIDIDSLIGLDSNGRAWVGITSATGRSMEQHEIVRWEINACPEDSPVSVYEGRPTGRVHTAPFAIVDDYLLRDDADHCVVSVVDLQGRVLWSASSSARKVELPAAMLHSGHYFVSVSSAISTTTVRWFVVH